MPLLRLRSPAAVPDPYLFLSLYETVRISHVHGNGILLHQMGEFWHEQWRQSKLAVDGVVVNGIENDNVLVLSCEMDPPGGWITRRINIFNGKEM